MIIDDRIIRDYLQAAQNRGGGWQMAMGMMASRLIYLEDRLDRVKAPFDPDSVLPARKEDA